MWSNLCSVKVRYCLCDFKCNYNIGDTKSRTRMPQCIRMYTFSNSSELLTISCFRKKIHDDISNGSRVIVLTNKQIYTRKQTLMKATHFTKLLRCGAGNKISHNLVQTVYESRDELWVTVVIIKTRGQSNLTKSASRGAHFPVRGHPRGSKVVPLNSWGRVSY